jgi:hypothetical protein
VFVTGLNRGLTLLRKYVAENLESARISSKKKRLGIPQPNKPQPLLVVLRSVDYAQQIIDNAKRLRKSADPEIRRQVFINRNLTRAESEAAY